MAGTGYRTPEPAVRGRRADPHSKRRRCDRDRNPSHLHHVTNDWLVTVIVADLTQGPVFLEELPDTLIAHPECDALPATPAVDLEIDHRTVFPFVRG